MDDPVRLADPEAGEAILTRECWIESPGGEVAPLTLSFYRPTCGQDGTFTAALRMSCKHFDETKRTHGIDQLQAFSLLLATAPIVLRSIESDGFSIWHLRRGDLEFFDFWTGKEFEPEFCLPSAYTEAKRDAFHRANAGKTLMPGHRIGIEPDRPAITIYKIREDGSDRLGCVIGAEEMKGHTWESLAQLVGERILWDSLEGIELMKVLQPDRGPDPDDQPKNARS